jgi:hypothetical protein
MAEKPDHIIEISSKTVHPLKWIQLEHINKIFGYQDITLLPEPVAIKNIQNPVNHKRIITEAYKNLAQLRWHGLGLH